jgi:hypothetical protein
VRASALTRLLGAPLFLFAASSEADPAATVSTEDVKGHLFYHNYDYGSEATFNPGTVLLNRGFDVMQLRPEGRGLFRQTYGRDAANVLRNVASPFKAIAKDGWGKFARQELLPLSFTPTTARWVPNYGLHLIGGGVTYSMLREWYEGQHVPLPAAFSVATMYGAAFINETLENAGVDGVNTDALADLYVFDLAGMLLFSIPAVNTFFSKYVIVADWSLQPALAVPTGDLHNVGNYYSVKIPVPFYERLRLFGYVGFSSMAGLSYKLSAQTSVSGAVGSRVANFENASTTQVENVVKLKPSAAIFFDRNNSLLASLQVSDVKDYFVHLNVYPGALTQLSGGASVFSGLQGLGSFTVIARDGHWITGISLSGFPLGAAVTNF